MPGGGAFRDVSTVRYEVVSLGQVGRRGRSWRLGGVVSRSRQGGELQNGIRNTLGRGALGGGGSEG